MVTTNAPLGANGVHKDGAEPRSDDAIGGDASIPEPLGSPCFDLVMHSPGTGMPKRTALGDAILTPRVLGCRKFGDC
jgi:hypothetical protein